MSVRKYAVGDRVVRRDGKVGEVIQVQSDPYPYLVDFGNRWAACWMSGLDLEPAAEAAPPSKAKADGDFATVEEHIAAWKAGGRRWAKVEGFNVDAWQADEEAKRRAAAEAARPMQIFADTSGELHVRMSDGAVAKLTGESLAPAEVEPDPVEARFVAMATAMAQDPAMAVLCGVPAVIEEARDPVMRELPCGLEIANAVRELALVVMTFTGRPLLGVVIESTYPNRVELQTPAGSVVVEMVRK